MGRALRIAGRVLALGLLIGLTAADWAHGARNLPKEARFGKLTEFAYPRARIGAKVLHMSPGAKIYNTHNLVIQPAAMRAPASVLFRLDSGGQLSGIWLLTAQEAAAYDRGAPLKPKPATPAQAAVPSSQAPAPNDPRLGGRQ